MSRRPILDLAECTLCQACLETAPQVFSLNPAGYIEVADLTDYPTDLVDEAIALCPADCIAWE